MRKGEEKKEKKENKKRREEGQDGRRWRCVRHHHGSRAGGGQDGHLWLFVLHPHRMFSHLHRSSHVLSSLSFPSIPFPTHPVIPLHSFSPSCFFLPGNPSSATFLHFFSKHKILLSSLFINLLLFQSFLLFSLPSHRHLFGLFFPSTIFVSSFQLSTDHKPV